MSSGRAESPRSIRQYKPVHSGSGRAGGWADNDESMLMDTWIGTQPQRVEVEDDPRDVYLQNELQYGVARPSVPRFGEDGGVGFLSVREKEKKGRQEQTEDWVRHQMVTGSPQRHRSGKQRGETHHHRDTANKQLRRGHLEDWHKSGGYLPRGGRKLYVESPSPDGSTGGMVAVPIPHPRHVVHPEHKMMEMWPGWRDHVIEGPPRGSRDL